MADSRAEGGKMQDEFMHLVVTEIKEMFQKTP